MKRYIVANQLKLVDVKTYDTSFGQFRIETREGKARRRDYTGKSVWKEVRSITGFFTEFPKAVEFFLYNDHGDKYVSSSQGNDSYDWVDHVGATTYDEALRIVDSEVVECFQDYYKDDSIR